MKILIIHNKYIQKGGEDTTVDNEYHLLKTNGENVNIHYFNNNGSKLSQLIKFLLYPVNIFSYFKVKSAIKKHQPDIVHIHNFHFTCSPLAFWALKRQKVPFVATIQNFRLICPSHTLFLNGELYLTSVEHPFSFKPVLDKAYNKSLPLTFWLYISNYFHFKINTWNLASKYIFVSNSSKHIFEKSAFSKYAAKFCIKNNFMSSDQDNHLVSAKSDYFIFIGRLEDYKGINTVIACCRQYNFKLIIIGDGDLRNEVINLSKENEQVTYLGFKQKDEILAYLSKAKALIFPSLWFEGMPLTIIEAFSVATPVIASNIGAMKEMIEDGVNGFSFKVGDAADLVDKIKFVQNMSTPDYELLVEHTAACFQTKYTPATNYHQLKKIYTDAISEYHA